MSDRKSLIVEIPFYKSIQALQSFFGGCIKKEGGKAEKGKGGRRETLIDFHRILYRQLSIYIVFDQNSKLCSPESFDFKYPSKRHGKEE
jgi:hypothetical protein